jgi:predicted DNA-binding transcriptional regulator AlpA
MPDSAPSREAVQLLADIIGKLGTSITPPVDPIIPEGLDGGDAATFLGISTSKLYELDSRGLCPEPVTLGDGTRCRRWVRSELLAWLKAGAPSRSRWAILKHQQTRKAG